MESLSDPELCIDIPLKSISEFFLCPICLDDLTDPHITTCGHIFCRRCIVECLDRRDKCPMCSQDVKADKLVKDHHFGSLLQCINQEKHRASERYMQHILHGSSGNGEQQDPVSGADGHEHSLHSPIEKVFMKHTCRMLQAFESYYQQLQEDHKALLAKLKASYVVKLEGIRARMRLDELKASHIQDFLGADVQQDIGDLAAPSLVRTDSSEKRISEASALTGEFHIKQQCMEDAFKRSVDMIVGEFEKHMQNLAPSPFLLSTVVSLTFDNYAMRFDVSLRATDTLDTVLKLAIERSSGMPDPILGFDDDVQFLFFNPGEDTGGDEKDDSSGRSGGRMISNVDDAIFKLKLIQGGELRIMGKLKLTSTVERVCFKALYTRGASYSQNYFCCKTCRSNWICENCAQHCHKDHNVIPFMSGHNPSYGCCYCMRTKLCTLPNKAHK